MSARAEWIEEARGACTGPELAELAERLGLQRKRRAIECPACHHVHGSGEWSGYIGRDSERFHCRHCRATLDAVGMVAVVELGSQPPAGDREGWRDLQALCAGHALCSAPDDIGDDAIRELQRRSAAANAERARAAAEREAAEAARRARGLPDIAAQLNAARLVTSPAVRRAYARDTRQLPEAIADAAASDRDVLDVTRLRFKRAPVPWAARRRTGRARLLAFPIYGADGVARSAALRRADGAPLDLGKRSAKSVNLSNGDTGGGMADWPGLEVTVDARGEVTGRANPVAATGVAASVPGVPEETGGQVATLRCRSFGSVPAAVELAVETGAPVFLVEGEADAMSLRAFLRADGRAGVVIGADGAGQLGNIAQVIRWSAPPGPPPPRVICIPDRDRDALEDNPAGRAMDAVRAELPDAEHIDITDRAGDVGELLAQPDGVEELHRRIDESRRWLDARPRNVSRTLSEAARYLRDLDLSELSGRVLCLRASMATGKTQQAARLARQAQASGGRVLALAPTRALSRGMAKRLNVPLYSDSTGPITTSAAVCINSLGRIAGAVPQLLVIDEITQVFDAIARGTVPHVIGERKAGGGRAGPDEATSIDVLDGLREMVRAVTRAGGAIIAADAFLTPAVVSTLRGWVPDAAVDVLDHLVEATGNACMVPTRDDAIALAVAAAEQGRTLAIATDSAEAARPLEELIRDALERAGVAGEVKSYRGGDPTPRLADLADARTSWGPGSGVAAVVCSPVVGSGVDAPAFDLVVGLFRGTIDAAAALQMLGRFRGSRRFVVWAAEGASDGALSTAYADIKAEFEGTAEASTAAVRRFLGRGGRMHFAERDAHHLHACILAERASRLRRQDYRRQIAACLSALGYTVETVDGRSVSQLRAVRIAMDNAGEDIKARTQAGIAQATPCSAIELARIDRDGPANDAEGLAAAHARLKRDHGDVTPELIAADDGRGKVARAGRLAAGAALAADGSFNQLARVDYRSLQSGSRASTRGHTRKARALILLLEAVFGTDGARDILAPPGAPLRGALRYGKATITPADCTALYEALTNSGPGLSFKPRERTGLGFRPRDIKSNPGAVAKAIGQVLNRLGVDRTSSKESTADMREAGRRTRARIYTIDPESLDLTRTWWAPFHARARGVRCNGLDPAAPEADAARNTAGDWWIDPGAYQHTTSARSAPRLDSWGRKLGQTPGIYKRSPALPRGGAA